MHLNIDKQFGGNPFRASTLEELKINENNLQTIGEKL